MFDQQVSLRAGLAAVVVSLLGLGGVVAYLLGGETDPPIQGSPPRASIGTVPDAKVAEFLGDQACAPCHPAISTAHRHSRHAATLHPVLAGHLPAPFPDHARFSEPATGLEYAVGRHGDRYLFQALTLGGGAPQPIEFAFGSGKTGITPVSRAENGTIREFRMSYFPFRHRWEVTPGQRGPAADPLGSIHDHATAQRCFGCHSTVIAASHVAPEPRFMGVGCEACHGPGRPHMDAIQRGSPDRKIDNPGRWDGERVNQLCGRCHRTERDLSPLDSFSLSQTQRFQPIGLAKSACFRASAGRLSCVTCHDAHVDARTDDGHYEAICRTCHAGGESGVQAFAGSRLRVSGVQDPSDPVRSRPIPSAPSERSTPADGYPRTPERLPRVCPINPRSGCIACHMPKREVVRGVTMADHWIRVYPAAPSEVATKNTKNAKQ